MRPNSSIPSIDKSKSKLTTTKSKADNAHSSRIHSDTSDVFSKLDKEIENDELNANDYANVTSKHKRTHQSLSSSSSLEVTKKNKPTFISNNRYSVLNTNNINENTLNNSTTDNNKDNNNESEQPQHIPSPPPIFVRNIKNYFIFRYDLINLIGPLNFTCQQRII